MGSPPRQLCERGPSTLLRLLKTMPEGLALANNDHPQPKQELLPGHIHEMDHRGTVQGYSRAKEKTLQATSLA